MKLIATALVALVLGVGVGQHTVDTDSTYQVGSYDGAHDLCQEVGGTWHNSQSGWCKMP